MRVFDVIHEKNGVRTSSRIATIGSCRVNDPFEDLANRGKALRVWAINSSASHTLGEAKQIIDYALGQLDIPAHFFPFVFNPVDVTPRTSADSRILRSVDIFFVEVCDLRQIRLGAYYFQTNNFWTSFVSKSGGAILPWYRNFSSGESASEEIIRTALANMGALGMEERALAETILRNARIERLDVESAADAIGRTIFDGDKQWIFVSHFVVPGLAGTQMQDRAMLIASLRQATERKNVKFFDPSEMIARHGREAMLANNGQDVYHYAPAMMETVASVLLNAAGLTLASEGRNPPPPASEGENLSVIGTTEWVNGTLSELHGFRLKTLGVDKSGLYDHYKFLLDNSRIADSTVSGLTNLISCILPRFDSYDVLRAGLGETAFVLAGLGLRSAAYDPDQYRFGAIEAGLNHFRARFPEMARRLTIGRTIIPDGPSTSNCLGVANHLIGLGDQEERTLDQLSRYRALLIEPRIFLRERKSVEEQEAIVETLRGRGFSRVQEFPAAGLVFCAKPD